jgi:hypothetical protein
MAVDNLREANRHRGGFTIRQMSDLDRGRQNEVGRWLWAEWQEPFRDNSTNRFESCPTYLKDLDENFSRLSQGRI